MAGKKGMTGNLSGLAHRKRQPPMDVSAMDVGIAEAADSRNRRA